MKNYKLLKGFSLIALVAILAAFAVAFIGNSSPAEAAFCPDPGYACLDVWNPVICSNGQVYSNQCYASLACATGCVPYGSGGPISF